MKEYVGLSDIIDEFQVQTMTTNTEGSKGVQNLCRLVHAMGYVDKQYFGQFSHDGSYGDLINFLEDNPFAVDALIEAIKEENNEEWAENLKTYLPDEEEEEEEEEDEEDE